MPLFQEPSLWDALKQYLRDAGPGGELNPETPDAASLIGSMIGINPSSHWEAAQAFGDAVVQTGDIRDGVQAMLPLQEGLFADFMGAGIIAGPKAKTANLAKLKEAQGLFGKAAEDEIYAKTGWWLGHPDGVPRFEIDDSGVKPRTYQLSPADAAKKAQTAALLSDDPVQRQKYLAAASHGGKTKKQLQAEYKAIGEKIVDLATAGRMDEANALIQQRYDTGIEGIYDFMRSDSAPLSGYFKHTELGAAYPDVYKMHTRVKAEEDLGNALGQYNKAKPGLLEQIWLGDKHNKSVALHETQHAIQEREDMARGGSPRALTALEIEQKKSDLLAKLRDFKDNGNAESALRELGFNLDGMSTVEKIKLQSQAITGVRTGEISIPTKDFDTYRRLAGEAEARLIQDRMNMTMPERMASPFYKGYDVPLSQQIIRRK